MPGFSRPAGAESAGQPGAPLVVEGRRDRTEDYAPSQMVPRAPPGMIPMHRTRSKSCDKEKKKKERVGRRLEMQFCRLQPAPCTLLLPGQ